MKPITYTNLKNLSSLFLPKPLNSTKNLNLSCFAMDNTEWIIISGAYYSKFLLAGKRLKVAGAENKIPLIWGELPEYSLVTKDVCGSIQPL